MLVGALAEVRARLDGRLGDLAGIRPDAFPPTAAGKLLRPRLLFAMMGEGGAGHGPEGRAISLALTVELIHLATLSHDDVLDDSPKRRRELSARETLGNKISILYGDALLAEALEIILRVGSRRMLRAVSRAVTATLRGELAQHLSHRTPDLDPRDCVRVAALKTGSLFGLAARLGAMHRDAPAEIEALAWRLGRRLGTAYQLIDDALDYAGSAAVLGKEPGSDFGQGIATLPLVLAWRGSAGTDRRAVLEDGFGRNGRADFTAVRAIVMQQNSFATALAAARQELERARGCASAVTPPASAALLDGVFAECEARLRDLV